METENDANTETVSAEAVIEDAGSSPDVDAGVELEPIVSDDGLISTVEYQVKADKEAAAEDKVDTKKTEPSDGAEQNTSEAASEKQDFHEHPRFKELIAEKNELKQNTSEAASEKQDFHEHPRFKELIAEKNELKQKLDEISKKIETKPEFEKPVEEQPDYQNIMSMDDEDIIDKVSGEPKEFFSNYAKQLMHEVKTELSMAEKAKAQKMEAATFEEKATKTYQEFFDSTPDGQELLDSGKIRDFVNNNPGHNAISAYYALAGEARVQAKIDAARKETEARIYKELKSAGRSKSISTTAGGRIINPDKSPEMVNPDKFGGRDKVLLDRLRARQAS